MTVRFVLWLLFSLAVASPCFCQPNEGARPSSPENLVRVESELPLLYDPKAEEWRTADGQGTIRLLYRDITLTTRRLRYRQRERLLEASEGVRLLSQRGLEFVGGQATYDENRR